MHAKILANASDIDDANLGTWAKEIGLNMGRFKKDIADPAIEARVDGMKADGEALGVVGTPDFYINGRHVEGGNSAERFEEIIDEELPRARALVASGVAPADVYERTIASGRPKVDSGY
jgi:predicted DsbA family dithiol-disulfide isomerase